MSSAPAVLPERERTKRRRKLRVLLLRNLKRLQKACDAIETPAQWYDLTKELRGAINNYRDVMPGSDRDALWLATLLTDQTHEGIARACSILQSRLVSVISGLPAAGLAAPLGLAAVALVVVVAAVGAIVLNVTTVTLNITNVGCPPIIVAANLPVAVPGLDFPRAVAPGATERASLPPLTLTTRFVPPDTLALNLFGVPLNYTLPAEAQSVTLDGIELLSGSQTIELGGRQQHDLVLRCR